MERVLEGLQVKRGRQWQGTPPVNHNGGGGCAEGCGPRGYDKKMIFKKILTILGSPLFWDPWRRPARCLPRRRSTSLAAVG